MSGNEAAGKALVFGASGMIGRQVAAAFVREGVAAVGFGSRPAAELAERFPYREVARDAAALRAAVAEHGPYDRVVWAQGVNRNDSAYDVEREALIATFDANVVFVAETMRHLLEEGLVRPGTRFCVISSIWQTVARQDKLSYTVSKAALQGLVASAAVDLARDGHLVNAVLPGVIDTAMTRAMLEPEQIARVEDMTLHGRLPAMADVVAAVLYLTSAANRSTTGQFLAVDLGMRHARLL